MKIRIKGNSVRLRLMQGEVTALEKDGKVSEQISFGNQQFLKYSLEQAEVEHINATYENNEIKILLPTSIAQSWAKSDAISLEHFVETGTEKLRILVEKDFKCLTVRAHEDESDTYPHPKEHIIAC